MSAYEAAHKMSAYEAAHKMAAHEVLAHKVPAHEMLVYDIPVLKMNTHEILINEVPAHEALRIWIVRRRVAPQALQRVENVFLLILTPCECSQPRISLCVWPLAILSSVWARNSSMSFRMAGIVAIADEGVCRL
jgi:hypothetical protein